MKYIDDIENTFYEFNFIIHNSIEFLNSLGNNDKELYSYVNDLLNTYIIKYDYFVKKNNISIDKVPDDIKKLLIDIKKAKRC